MIENPNWSPESLQDELDLHLIAAAFLLQQLINRHQVHLNPTFEYVQQDEQWRVKYES